MFIVVTIATVVYVTTSAGKPRLRPHYGDGDDDRAYVPPDTGIGIPYITKFSTIFWSGPFWTLSRILILVKFTWILAKSTKKTLNLTPFPEDDFLPDAKPLRIVTRNEWLAQPPREKLDDLKLPVHKVIIAHTATEECSTQVRTLTPFGYFRASRVRNIVGW